MIKADKGPNEQSKPVRLFPGVGYHLGIRGAAIQQHLLQSLEILTREGFVAAESLQSDVVLVLLQVRGGLRMEPVPVGAGGNAGQLNECGLGQLVLSDGGRGPEQSPGAST